MLQHQRGFLLGTVFQHFTLTLDGCVDVHRRQQFLDGSRLVSIASLGESKQRSETSHHDQMFEFETLVHCCSLEISVAIRPGE